MVMTMMMGHECIWGLSWGRRSMEEEGKGRTLRDGEDGSMLHVSIEKQHNETH
jgi:hypothetical protein